MKILLLNEGLPAQSIGGSGRVVQETAVALAERGHEVHILTSAKGGKWPGAIKGVTVHALEELPQRWAHYRSVFSRSRERQVVQIIDQVKPDILHAHGVAWQIGYRWMDHAITKKIPCFYTAHGMMTVSYGKILGTEKSLFWKDLKRARWTVNPFRNGLIRKRLNRITKMLCVSDALLTYLSRFGYNNMTTLYNGIDLRVWKRTKTQKEAREALKLPQDIPLFLLAGRLGHDKGLQSMFDIWPKLTGGAQLVLAGQIPPGYIEGKSGIHVFQNQSAEQMRGLYEACDVNLVPSICFDCLPTTGLESMAIGTPIIGNLQGGAREEMIPEQTGWVVDALDPDALRKQIQWCVDHRAELPAIGEKAAAFIADKFSLEKHVERLLQLYSASVPH